MKKKPFNVSIPPFKNSEFILLKNQFLCETVSSVLKINEIAIRYSNFV